MTFSRLKSDEWPSVDWNHNAKIYFRNKDIQIGEMKTDNSNNMIYRKGVPAEANSKSNISDTSEDYLNQYKKIPIENNNIIAGNTFETDSPIGYKKIIIIYWG